MMRFGLLFPVLLPALWTSLAMADDLPPYLRNFTNTVTAGYQAWFATADDGVTGYWTHWSWQKPAPGKISFELYPDVRDYAPDSLSSTDLGPLGNGQPSKLYSASKLDVIDQHFRWMKKYGIDGIGLTRFLVGTQYQSSFNTLQTIIPRVRQKAEEYGRSWYFAYDTTGFDTSLTQLDLIDWLKQDWEGVERSLDPVSSPNYARQNGRPVIVLWGFGFPENAADYKRAKGLVEWFHQKGFYVVGGVPWGWRHDMASNSDLYAMFKSFDMISPWSVGGYSSDADVESNYRGIWIDDKKQADSWGQDYLRVIFPGFAWSNWVRNADGSPAPHNAIPRRGGDLMWTQAYYGALLKAPTVVAMFDEYDEGTAIAKAAPNPDFIPKNQYFLTLAEDHIDMTSDFYLRLTGAITQLLLHTPEPALIPKKHSVPFMVYEGPRHRAVRSTSQPPTAKGEASLSPITQDHDDALQKVKTDPAVMDGIYRQGLKMRANLIRTHFAQGAARSLD